MQENTTWVRGWVAYPHVAFPLKMARWALWKYWESNSPDFMHCRTRHVCHASSQSPATCCVFKSVVSSFSAVLNARRMRNCHLKLPHQHGLGQHIQMCFSRSFMTNPDATVLVSLPVSQGLEHSVTSFPHKIAPDFNRAFPGEV